MSLRTFGARLRHLATLARSGFDTTAIRELAFVPPWYLSDRFRHDPRVIAVGRYSYGHTWSPRVLGAEGRLTIGAFCSVAPGVRIFLDYGHNPRRVSAYPLTRALRPERYDAGVSRAESASRGDVHIGNDVWIGEAAIVLSGVAIGDGAVVGTGAVVTKDVPPYTVAAGNPARIVRQRFTDEQVAALLRIRWWDWPDERIIAAIPLLESPEVAAFIREYDWSG